MTNINKRKYDFLDKNVFFGLQNLNDGFDVPSIKYFSEEDFEIILIRVKEQGLGIFGIEPWQNGIFYDCLTCEEYKCDSTDSDWYYDAFNEFKAKGEELQYAASYFIPESLLFKKLTQSVH